MLKISTIRNGSSTTVSPKLFILFLMLITWQSFAQAIDVTGKVQDGTGLALPGVNVLVKGTTVGTTTDSNGNFKISSSPKDILVFSFIGYQTQEITVGTQTNIDVTLTTDITSLDEVVVVGYGSVKKSDLTGSVSLVKSTEMTKVAASDATQMLQGRVAGVSVVSDGQPGSAPSVRIRGIATFGYGNSQPLYVVDGVVVDGIRDFNPNDIESVQVLKDASAGAIYGARAANGVIIITTKRGALDKPMTVELNSYYGVQQVPKKIPVLSRTGYQLLNNEMRANNPAGPLGPVPGNDPNSPDFINDIDTDWQDVGFKTGIIQNHSVGFTGGSKSASYNMNLDYFKNSGTLVGNVPNYERISARVNSEAQKGIFKVGENFYLVHSEENPLYGLADAFGGSNVNDMIVAVPTMPYRDPNRVGGFGGTDEIIHNAIALNVPGMNQLIDNEVKVNRMLANVYAEVKPLRNFNYRINLAYDYTVARDHRFIPLYDLGYFYENNSNARASSGIRQYTNGLVENTLTYEKTFDSKHAVTVMVGQAFQQKGFYTIGGSTSQLREPYLPTLDNGEGEKGVFEFRNTEVLSSLLGRLNYSFDDRYLITANFRRDASSNFNPDVRAVTYPSFAAAWKIHNEKFLAMPAFIEELKLRAGWGQVANQAIDPYDYLPVINQNIPYAFGDSRVLGAAATVLVDYNLEWELRTTRNIGIDAGLFGGKLDVTLEYYSNVAEDLLIAAPIPGSTGSLPTGTGGVASIRTNAGGMKNSGVEVSFTYRKSTGDFTFEISPNMYTVRNRVTQLNTDRAFLNGAGARTEVGKPIGSHYGWVYDGIFQTVEEIAVHPLQPGAAPGDIRFKNLDGNNVINDADRTYIGKALPDVYYGLNFTARYKNFDATFFASGSGGNKINNALYRQLMNGNSYGNYHEDLLNRWTPENRNTDIPRMVLLDPNTNVRDSDRPGWLENGTYLRINTLSFGYNVPANIVKGLSSARIYATCQNLYTFSSYKGFNPDFNSGILNPGFDGGSFPKPRTYMLGVQLRF
jgi:TonB-dependent starch-binding outer membrane protein SusC